MPSTDAATGKKGSLAQSELSAKLTEGLSCVSVREHYDLLIEEGNDPVLDPPELAAYMDGWDGEALYEELELTDVCRVLEIGVGTGRLALRTLARGCLSFTGMDLSEKTLEAAREHLSAFRNVTLTAGEFPKDAPEGPFDRIYSSLTFLHIEDKESAIRAAAALLAPGGRMVLSLDRERSGVLDMGSRCVKVYPDDPERICALLRRAGLSVRPVRGIERAWLITAEREM